jgi:hypothetical protein
MGGKRKKNEKVIRLLASIVLNFSFDSPLEKTRRETLIFPSRFYQVFVALKIRHLFEGKEEQTWLKAAVFIRLAPLSGFVALKIAALMFSET